MVCSDVVVSGGCVDDSGRPEMPAMGQDLPVKILLLSDRFGID
jgi:hypothetical protein